MNVTRKLTAAALCLGVLAPAAPVAAQDAEAAIKARQGQMRILSLNLGVLGGMAKGEIEYSEEMAQYAADNLVTAASINQSFHWPEGSDTMSVDGTRALPAIWENVPDVMSNMDDLRSAAAEMQTAAAEGPEAIGAALQKVGGTCKACHDDYRESTN
jgi:cytochrome c556